MTDPTTPTDEELSLALDGEADAELLARIEADPTAEARLEELRAAVGLVAAPVAPLDDDTVDSIVDAALDTPIAPPRVAARPRGRATPWIVAAAVVLLMAAGLSLVWAGRGTDDDQAGASRTTAETEASGEDAPADSSFAESSGSGTGSAADAGDAGDAATPLTGGHGSPTTAPQTTGADLPVLFLGSYDTPDALREATAASFADALAASDSRLSFDGPDAQDTSRAMDDVPSDASVDRCAQQLQVTLKLAAGPIQAGYATVDDRSVLVYEFAATSARDGKATTLVAAVGTEACDEVVLFER